MGVLIRPWQERDLQSIRSVTWESWHTTYSSFIPESDLKSYFDVHYAEASLRDMFNDRSIYGVVAETNDLIAGYLRLEFRQKEDRLYASSLYLLPKYQSQDIGTRLLEAAEEYATQKNLNELWIGVMVKNTKALAFYQKVGFAFVREEPFVMGKATVSHLIGYKKLGKSILVRQKT